MRQTLHDYVIEKFDNAVFYPATVLIKIKDYAKLTNRAPKLGDFVPCGDDGNVLIEPSSDGKGFQDLGEWKDAVKKYAKAYNQVIFEGDWMVIGERNHYTVFIDERFVIEFLPDGNISANGKFVTRIEDLPKEITFKEGVV